MLRKVGLAATATTLAAILTSVLPAQANGRFPRAERLVESAADPNRLMLAATYGLLVTEDRGATWHYICEGSFAHMAVYSGDPIVDFASDGSLLVGAQTSLSVSNDHGCNWVQTLGGADDFIVDHAFSKSSPSTVVAALVTASPTATTNTLRESVDDGRTWTPFGNPVPLTAMLTVDVDPLDPGHIYVSGIASGAGQLAVSADHGSTWTLHPILDTGSDDVPYIAGIHPSDPNRIFVRTDSSRADANGVKGDSLLYSDDGGVSWRQLHTSAAKLLGFALSPDGSKVLIGYGNPTSGNFSGPYGIYESDTSSLSFERVYGGHVNCLTWTKTGIYVCSDETRDGFELGFAPSPDFDPDGSCLVPLLHRNEVGGPLICDPSTTGAVCEANWPSSCMALGACEKDAAVRSRTCVAFTPQGDASIGGGAGGSIGGGSNGGEQPGGSRGASSPPSSAGCGCVAARRSGSAGRLAWSVVILSLGLLARRRGRTAQAR